MTEILKFKMFEYLLSGLSNNPILDISLIVGAMALCNFFYAKLNKNAAIQDDSSQISSRVLALSSLLKSVSSAFLYRVMKFFIAPIILFFVIIGICDMWHLISYPITFAFSLGGLMGIVCIIITLFICIDSNSTGGVTAALVAGGKHGAQNGFIAASTNARTLSLVGSFIILTFQGIVYFLLVNYSKAITIEFIEGTATTALMFTYLIRIAGGVFTKAADIGSDLAGKIFADMNEDDEINPGVISDAGGDGTGDGAGTASTILTLYFVAFYIVISNCELDKFLISIAAVPIVVSSIIVCMPKIDLYKINPQNSTRINASIVEKLLRQPIWGFAFVMTCLGGICMVCSSTIGSFIGTNLSFIMEIGKVFCFVSILLVFLAVSMDYFTSSNSIAVGDTTNKTLTMGSGMNILHALQYSIMSVILIFSIGLIGIYMRSILQILILIGAAPILMYIDILGPMFDNAGTLAEMAQIEGGRDNTEILDSAGNTIKSRTKGIISGILTICFGLIIGKIELCSSGEFLFWSIGGFVAGMIISLAINALSMLVTISGADMAFKVIRTSMEAFIQTKGAPFLDAEGKIKKEYYTSVSEKIADYAFCTGPLTILLLIPGLKSKVFGIGLFIVSLIFAIIWCTFGAIVDNVKKNIEEKKADLKNMKQKLLTLETEIRKECKDFSIEGLEADHVKDYPPTCSDMIEQAWTLKKAYTNLARAREAGIQCDMVGDVTKDVSGPVLHLVCLFGLLSLSA